ncbi:Phenolpthiocerol synthesis polyketide synthase ppsA [Monoraphidium neglectum]|uniref:Phenolpthiocerol synthesis polyketide synthase ppsA n=1 Tax=Monoraphidium neglectum TaxID=145388 RepID=A0A0D2MDB8_9CHLO|nr:Phenolpthiocerol synthesis polyketide synthase ppsA [Monoraphidium neglectum]KIZ01150.1 Phenolpthiocerol synthesis polyketide synthase ppsA [Monoraphidium neglectum]|eukprot:XP_013900169.1 Phenolpthiocerol synthesis polyketide synthase ppsA [Monoraphidium neglectum]
MSAHLRARGGGGGGGGGGAATPAPLGRHGRLLACQSRESSLEGASGAALEETLRSHCLRSAFQLLLRERWPEMDRSGGVSVGRDRKRKSKRTAMGVAPGSEAATAAGGAAGNSVGRPVSEAATPGDEEWVAYAMRCLGRVGLEGQLAELELASFWRGGGGRSGCSSKAGGGARSSCCGADDGGSGGCGGGGGGGGSGGGSGSGSGGSGGAARRPLCDRLALLPAVWWLRISPSALLEFLAAKRCALSPVPPGRYPPGALSPAAAALRLGVLPEGAPQALDHRFFRVSPAAVADIDPQQRMALEVTYEALQDAGLSMESLRGLDVGVFAGVGLPEFPIQDGAKPGAVGTVGGTYGCFIPNRVSHFFDFTGPSVALDTACSSSLTALHMAANSLRAGDCSAAIVLGTTALLSSYVLLGALASGAVSPTGDSRPFDAAANGFVRAEGAVAILLVPVGPCSLELGDALGGAALRPYGYIVGSGAGADGAKPSAVAPSAAAQQRLMRQVHKRAGVDPADVCYVEAHATGTPVGDPIEAASIGAVLGCSGRTIPLPIGSLKGNLGHLESAAGLAGLVKVLITARHRLLLPSGSFSKWSPKIDAAALNLRVVTEVEPLVLPPESPAFIGINSFGMGGANAYAIVRAPEEGEELEVVADITGACVGLSPRRPPPPRAPLLPLPLAAHDRSLLAPYQERWAELASAGGDVDAAARAHQRAAALGLRFRAVLLLPAAPSARGGPVKVTAAPGLAPASARGVPPRVGVVFCGQGTHSPAMGGELWTHLPAFRAGALEFAAAYPGPPLLLTERDWPPPAAAAASPGLPFAPAVAAALAAPPETGDLRLTLPAVMMVGYAQWRLLSALGLRCAAAAGHSAGEMLAALAAGEIDLQQLCQLTYARAAALAALPTSGGMAAVSGPRADVEQLLAEASAAAGAVASIAAVNAPGQFTVSGAAVAVGAFAAAAGATGLRARPLPGARAFHHGPSVAAVRGAFFRALEQVGWSDQPEAPLPLTGAATAATGRAAPAFCTAGVPASGPDGAGCRSAERWWQQLLRPVDFEAGLSGMRAARCEAVIELGPRSVLSGYAAASLPGAAALALVRGTEKGSELRDAFEAVAQLWLGGAEVRWAALLQRGPAGADFPRMPWLHAVNAGGGAAAFHSSKSSGARTIEHVVAAASKALVQVPALITAAAVLPAEKHAAAATPVNGAGGGAAADAAVRGGKGLAADASGAVAGAEVAAFAADFGELTAALEAREAPTLCLVAGRAEGGGLLLPPLADVVFATADSTFSLPGLSRGRLPAVFSRALRHCLPATAICRLALTYEPLPAPKAEAMGLVDAVFATQPAADADLAASVSQLSRLPPALPVSAKRLPARSVEGGQLAEARAAARAVGCR